MREPKAIAISALKEMLAKVGPDAEFPGDAIWEYASEEVEPLRKPPVFKALSSEGYIEDTGEKTNAVTPDRRAAPTTKYRFGPLLRPNAPSVTSNSMVARSFATACEGILSVQEIQCIRLCTSLLSKRFLILTGLAGSGKTKIAQAFARWITPDPTWIDAANHAKGKRPNPHYVLIPVGADWTGNENIVGYPNGLNDKAYVTKPALELIRHALEPANAKTPHFLILDEMNLSHVERYFADLLSAIESEEPLSLYEGDMNKPETWRETGSGSRVQPIIQRLPDNLFIIGTVNVDETTYMFSPKVLDRANVIEFRMEPGELEAFLESPAAPKLDKLDGKGAPFGQGFVAAAADRTLGVPEPVKNQFQAEMLLFFNTLREHDAEFGYRVGYEAARFTYFYKLLGGYPDDNIDWFNDAMDAVIVQKFLPKLHGSRSKLEGLLWALAWACGAERVQRDGKDFAAQLCEAGQAQDESKYSPDIVWTQLANKNADDPASAARHPLSFGKVMRMWRKLLRDQFVSFAEA